MIRPKDMIKVSLFAYNKDREKVLTKLHRLGIIQLIDLKSSDIELDSCLPAEQIKDISDYLIRVSRLNHILTLVPPKKDFMQNLFGLETTKKAIVKRKTKNVVIKESERFLKEYETKLINLEEQHTELVENKEEIKRTKKIINILESHKLPTEYLGETKNISFTTGKIANQNIPKIKEDLNKELEGYVHIETKDEGKESVIVIISLKENNQKVNFIVKKHGVDVFAVSKVPESEDAVRWINEKEEENSNKINDILIEIEKYQRMAYDDSIFLREELEVLKEKFESLHKLKESKSFFVMQGWVTKDELKKLRENMTEAVIHDDNPHEKDEVPVELSNPWFYKPFEMLTELYALPNYKDLDPTFIVAPLFLVYAGFMLTDFVYGLGLVILGGVIFYLFRKQAKSMRYIGINIIGIGAFAMVFGVLTGSYLGDAPQYFFGIPTAKLAIWADPLADPLYFLIISLFVGLVHLNIGLVLGLIEDIRKKQWKVMLSDRVIWWVLQIAILAFVLKAQTIGWILLTITILMVIVLQGPLGLLGMTGFMGDVISYSRLFALALSTAGIAMTVNLLSDMLYQVPFIGFIAAALVFIVGHLFSFFMNALGSFVHSIRLQFVEFFGKFYEGGGDKFTPFKEERIYTEVEE